MTALRMTWPSHHPGLAACIGGFALLMTIVLLAPPFLGIDGEAMAVDAILSPPDGSHWLGTDQLGRDVLGRTLLGGRSTISLAMLATILGVGLGSLIGLVAGYLRGTVDEALMRLGDAIMALPSLILAMLVMVAVGSGSVAILAAIVLIFAPRSARIVRSVVLNVVNSEFVAAAGVVGESRLSVMLREILPNIWPNILVEASLRFSYSILIISALGYLGIGLQPPTPDWGLMISDAAAYVTIAPWMLLGPAFGILLSVIVVNMLGDTLQDYIGLRARRSTSHV